MLLREAIRGRRPGCLFFCGSIQTAVETFINALTHEHTQTQQHTGGNVKHGNCLLGTKTETKQSPKSLMVTSVRPGVY